MPRLDVWLVKQGMFSSRQIAKRAIKAGHVIVNGKVAKPSTIVDENDLISIAGTAQDVPFGYYKISQIFSQLDSRIIGPGDIVLDIGCSAGGFLSFLLKYGTITIGIDVSDEFIENLERMVNENDGLSIVFDNAFKIDILVITDFEKLDLLIIDVTIDPQGTLLLLERFTPLLKIGGHAILALKIDPKSPLINDYVIAMMSHGYSLIRQIVLDESRKEVHLVALRKKPEILVGRTRFELVTFSV